MMTMNCGNGNLLTKPIQEYFDECKAYWMSIGDDVVTATRKALEWDCEEVWNFDNSWTDDQRKFVAEMKEKWGM